MIARTIPIAFSVAALIVAPVLTADAQVQQQQQTQQAQTDQQRGGALATTVLTTDAAAAQIVGDTTLKAFTGRAKAEISLVQASKEVCYDIALTDVPNVTEARIHRGPLGENGPSVLVLALKKDSVATKACAKPTDEVFTEISSTPSRFYLVVSTTDHPAGVVRGQLAAKPPAKN
jgi:hypothetical protein